jgi:hypothetical protein
MALSTEKAVERLAKPHRHEHPSGRLHRCLRDRIPPQGLQRCQQTLGGPFTDADNGRADRKAMAAAAQTLGKPVEPTAIIMNFHSSRTNNLGI